ncbi:MAG: NAD-dependent epimerase/dehydratase family protein, partial [Candidatus Omnitrophota bacterium]
MKKIIQEKNILVTGGAGFIGSHIAERLIKDGNAIRILDNFFSGKYENLSFVNDLSLKQGQYSLIEGDIRNYDVCLAACEDVDIVFHQAALRSVPRSFNNPYEYNEVNVNGTLNILKAAHEKGVKRLVFASSSSIYGDVDKFPQSEGQYPELISPYALTKLTGEYYCRIFSKNFGLETVSLRYFNVFGPRQALDDEYAVVIPKFINCILND